MRELTVDNEIAEQLSHFVTTVKAQKAMSRTDINRVAQNVLVPILKETYGFLCLRNLDIGTRNFPAIDLADDNAKVAIQVTSTIELVKVKRTLDRFLQERPEFAPPLSKRYDRLIVYILTERQKTYSQESIDKLLAGRFRFDTSKDIWDYRSLLTDIQGLALSTKEKVLDILRTQSGSAVSQITRATFATRAEFVARLEGNDLLVGYQHTLQGRHEELAALSAFLEHPNHRVAILPGRGGIGKTKLIYDWTSGLTRAQPYFLRQGAEWQAGSPSELPNDGQVVVIVDDAHRVTNLSPLLTLTQDQRVKVLLLTRPSAKQPLHAELNRHFDPAHVDELPELKKLDNSATLALIRECLGDKHSERHHWLARAAQDTPLIAVMACRIMLAEAILSDKKFRRDVMARFDEEYTNRLPADGTPWRELLAWLAAATPFQLEGVALVVSQQVGRSKVQIKQAIATLLKNGLLIREGHLMRLVPDPLADYLLEEACAPPGIITGFAETAFRALAPIDPSTVLGNLGELDWRLRSENGQSALLDGLFSEILDEFKTSDAAGRLSIIRLLKDAPGYQPKFALDIARLAMDTEALSTNTGNGWSVQHKDVLQEVPRLLSYAAVYGKNAREPFDRLLRLHSDHESRSEARRVFLELIAISRFTSTSRVLKGVELAQSALGRGQGGVLAFEVADKVLAKELDYVEEHGETVEINALPFRFDRVAPIRHQALLIIEQGLRSTDPAVLKAAFTSAGKVLSLFCPKFRAEVSKSEQTWQDAERLRIIEGLQARASTASVTSVIWQTLNLLRDHFGHTPTVERAMIKALAAIPMDVELLTIDALCSGWDLPCEDFKVGRNLKIKLIHSAAKAIMDHFPDPDQQLHFLATCAAEAGLYGIADNQLSAMDLIAALTETQPTFVNRLFAYLIGEPHPLLIGDASFVLVKNLRRIDLLVFRDQGIALARKSSKHAFAVCAAVSHGSDLSENPCSEDLQILAAIAQEADSSNLESLVFGLFCLLDHADLRQPALELLAATEFTAKARQSFINFTFHGPGQSLHGPDFDLLLRPLVRLRQIPDWGARSFLEDLAARDSATTVEFLMNRLAWLRDPAVEPGFIPWTTNLTRLLAQAKYVTPPDLHRLPAIMGGADQRINRLACELYWGLASTCPAIQANLDQWTTSPDPNEQQAASVLSQYRSVQSERPKSDADVENREWTSD